MPEINVFNDGLNKRVDAQYLQSTQGRTVHNINLDKGTLNSRPLDQLAGFGERGLLPFWWRGKLFSNSEDAIFVEFDRRMFKNSGGAIFVSDYWDNALKDPLEWSPVGLENPEGTIAASHILWGDDVVEYEDECGTLYTPMANTEFIMMRDDVARYHMHAFKFHTSPFFLEFYTQPDGATYTLYMNKGADNYTYVGTSNDGTPIRYGCTPGIGESPTGDNESATIDDMDSIVRVDDDNSLGVVVDEVVSDGEKIEVKYVLYEISGTRVIRTPTEIWGIEIPVTAGVWTVIDSTLMYSDGSIVLRIWVDSKLIDFEVVAAPTKELRKSRITSMGVDYGEDKLMLIAEGKIHTMYRNEIEIMSMDLDNTTVEYMANDLILEIQEDEYIADYWLWEEALYGIISSGNQNRLYKLASDVWEEVADFEGQYWGASHCNNVNANGMYLTFRESIMIWNGATIDFQKPKLRVPEPYFVDDRHIEYSLFGDKLTALSKALSDVVPTSSFIFDINMDLDITPFSDLDRSNMLYGSYTYTMAYENSDGSQSDILTSSSSVYVPTGHVEVYMPQSIIDDIPVDGELILFRTMGVGGQFYEVTRWAYGETIDMPYIDQTHDADLGLPPTNVGGNPPIEGINHLTEHRGRLYGTVDNRLYFSEYGDVHNWPPINYLVMPQEITGVASIANGLVVFSYNTTTILLGSDIEDYQVRPVDKLVGCMNFRTIQPAKSGAFFVAYDGLYFCDGSTVKNISEDALGNFAKFDRRLRLPDITNSVFVADEYVLSLTEYFFSMDLARGMKFSTFADNSYDRTGYASISTNAGLIFGHKGGVSYELANSSTGLSLLEFKSGDMTEGAVTNLKEYDKLRVVFKGEFTIIVWLEDGTAITKEISSEDKILQMIGFNNNKNRGIFLNYSIIGRGTIYAMDFIIKGRSNQP